MPSTDRGTSLNTIESRGSLFSFKTNNQIYYYIKYLHPIFRIIFNDEIIIKISKINREELNHLKIKLLYSTNFVFIIKTSYHNKKKKMHLIKRGGKY